MPDTSKRTEACNMFCCFPEIADPRARNLLRPVFERIAGVHGFDEVYIYPGRFASPLPVLWSSEPVAGSVLKTEDIVIADFQLGEHLRRCATEGEVPAEEYAGKCIVSYRGPVSSAFTGNVKAAYGSIFSNMPSYFAEVVCSGGKGCDEPDDPLEIIGELCCGIVSTEELGWFFGECIGAEDPAPIMSICPTRPSTDGDAYLDRLIGVYAKLDPILMLWVILFEISPDKVEDGSLFDDAGTYAERVRAADERFCMAERLDAAVAGVGAAAVMADLLEGVPNHPLVF